MKLALATFIDKSGTAAAAAVAFDDWGDAEATRTWRVEIAQVEKAPRGELDLRELPWLMRVIESNRLQPEAIVIDDFVFLDPQDTPGLGKHLFDALGGRVPVIGASKAAMKDTPAQFEVFREDETPPLVVTCAGIDLGAAKARVRMMHGRKRMPTLMKLAARVAKGSAG